ncbi:MAG: hypothetical protein ACHQJ6_06975 [Candidatus Berkiellales bacterium]
MPSSQFFKEIAPAKVGRYNHDNDKFMKDPTKEYQTPSAPSTWNPRQHPPHARHASINTPVAPQVIIIQREPDPWTFYWMMRAFDFNRPTINVSIDSKDYNKDKKNDKEAKKKENEQAGIIAAVMFFAVVLAAAVAGVAYNIRIFIRIVDNLSGARKVASQFFKSAMASILAISGIFSGIELGAYYGPALFGTAAAGSLVASLLLGIVGAAIGFVAAKYLIKLFNLVYTSGATSQTDPYSLRPSVERALAYKLVTPTVYLRSRPNLMLGYIVNKIEIAKQNKASQQWIDTLEGFRKALKAGDLSNPEIMKYFDRELVRVRYDWNNKMSGLKDPRIADHESKNAIDYDYKALAIITSNEGLIDQDFQWRASYFQRPPSAYPDLREFSKQPASSTSPVPSYDVSHAQGAAPVPTYAPSFAATKTQAVAAAPASAPSVDATDPQSSPIPSAPPLDVPVPMLKAQA